MRFKLVLAALLMAFLIAGPGLEYAAAFQGEGCGAECMDCHSLTKAEAGKLLKTEKFRAEVTDIRMSPVKGLWEVEIRQGDKRFKVYMDFAKKYLVEGAVNFTPLEKIGESPPLKKVDLKKIPLDNAIIFGDPKAQNRIIVFDDPDCPYCEKLHKEIKKIIAERDDVVFYIKLYPLPIHPKAYAKSKAIVCEKSVKLLEDAFAGKTLPEPKCETTEVDDNIKLAAELGIRGTPAIIFPDGRLLPGYVPANVLMDLLENPQ
jgi:thiol:disulfide interchange protein DsbC